jgi:hypothetical protein
LTARFTTATFSARPTASLTAFLFFFPFSGSTAAIGNQPIKAYEAERGLLLSFSVSLAVQNVKRPFLSLLGPFLPLFPQGVGSVFGYLLPLLTPSGNG